MIRCLDEDDAKFEAEIALAIAKLESVTLPPNDVAKLYALLWVACHAIATQPNAREMFEQCAGEAACNYPWPV